MLILILLSIIAGVVIFLYSLGSDEVVKVRSLTWFSAILITYGVCVAIEISDSRRKPIEDDEVGGKSNRKPIKGWEF